MYGGGDGGSVQGCVGGGKEEGRVEKMMNSSRAVDCCREALSLRDAGVLDSSCIQKREGGREGL